MNEETVKKGANGAHDKAHAHPERDQLVLQAVFSDETEAFRSPAQPQRGQSVMVRLRVERQLDVRASVLVGAGPSQVSMRKLREDDLFIWYEARIMCGLEPVRYRFLVETPLGDVICQKGGCQWADDPVDPRLDFLVRFGLSTPAWAQGALQYQILPDRFANGNEANDVVNGEYAYNGALVRKAPSWDALPQIDDYRCFYGGDLQGIMDKLDYLQSIGVEVLYLNPIFLSPSSHGYDTQDYDHIDPHLAVIDKDLDSPLPEGRTHNTEARQYIRRITSKKNLRRSDKLFAKLCQEIHRRGMRIILDGVFNHCGSFSKWMDREGIYRTSGEPQLGAFQSLNSPYRHFFRYAGHSSSDYEAWWDFSTLPKLNYEDSPELCARIIGVARHWAQPPYSIDGWRLDVAADLGHDEDFNHAFWRGFRSAVKEVNPDLLIVAEHYGDPSSWLEGDQWDTVMNYDAFMDPLTFFLTGMEKHSDGRNERLYQNGEAFWRMMRIAMSRFGWPSLLCAMNELSNHDHSRFLTRTNGVVGRIDSAGSEAAGVGVDRRVMCEAVVVQMTWPGAPTIYYADEAGQVGWTDPDCRRTYPWGEEDQQLIDLHRRLAALRRQHVSLRTGSFVPLGGGTGWIAFGRFQGDDRIAVVCNNADEPQAITLRLRKLGMRDGQPVTACLSTSEYDELAEIALDAPLAHVEQGTCTITIPPRTALILE